MLYLSVALVLCGVLILIYAIFFRDERDAYFLDDRINSPSLPKMEIETQRMNEETDEEQYVDYRPDETDNHRPKYRRDTIGQQREYRNPDVEQPAFAFIKNDDEREKKAVFSERTAVLYEDSSNIIDYANRSGSIDPSLEEYRKIRRIGRGRLIIENGSLLFNVDKKAFRFDFSKIHDIKAGGNYIAVFMKGSDAIKLFIFLKKSDYISMIVRKFKGNAGFEA